jgi:hypothetical protein
MRPYLVHLRNVEAFKRFVEFLVRFGNFFYPSFEHAPLFWQKGPVVFTHPTRRIFVPVPSHRLLCNRYPWAPFFGPFATREKKVVIILESTAGAREKIGRLRPEPRGLQMYDPHTAEDKHDSDDLDGAHRLLEDQSGQHHCCDRRKIA